MKSGDNLNSRLVAWNGVRLSPPVTWEPRVAGIRHLVFEEEFQPLLQIRWQREAKATADTLHRIARDIAGPTGSVLSAKEAPALWHPLGEKFQLLVSAGGGENGVTGGVCFCRKCRTLLQFQVFSGTNRSRQEVGQCLATLSCHGEQDTLWRIQDFSLATPRSFALIDYNFAAGLTRLSFADRDQRLQTCTLAPADIRLQGSSLADILHTLCGAGNLVMHQDEAGESCEGVRTPGIAGRVLLRLRRAQPYIRARIRHDPARNRLLAVILSANRPIPPALLQSLCNNYEIIQKERTAKTADPN
jgi:hypothetical protein